MANVYFLPIEKIGKFEEFLDKFNFLKNFQNNDKIALKIHFGNSHHKNQVPPEFLFPVVEKLKEQKVFGILTDTNVLYRGERDDTFSHLEIVYKNGYDKLGTPILIAGGFDADYEFDIEIDGKHFKKLYYAKEYEKFDGMIAITHFKGHMLSGIGGTLKNVGMGCASRKGKFAMHSNLTPIINLSTCTGCEKCSNECPFGAISIKEKKAYIDKNKCKGCAWCVHVCPFGAINIPWSSVKPEEFQERIVEYAYGLIKFYKDKFLSINFLINIAGDCDCCSNPGEILSKDIGVCISEDPVAVDKCSSDLVKEINGKDVFLEIKPKIDYSRQFDYAEKIGLGTTKYRLIVF
ncbi:MAG: DUF362 domain-containing protein [bacterium]|nr:DUF362 domain-containing protein [bacterium]MDW8164841.1 DUF362 domain-containing protein [Candidatus Omnitrophota bacterium]